MAFMRDLGPGPSERLIQQSITYAIAVIFCVPTVVFMSLVVWASCCLIVVCSSATTLYYVARYGPAWVLQRIRGTADASDGFGAKYHPRRPSAATFAFNAANPSLIRNSVVATGYPDRMAVIPSSRRASTVSVRDFAPPMGGPVGRPRSDSIASFASNVDQDFGDTGGWAYSFEDDEALWMVKNNNLGRIASISPGLKRTSEANFGRNANPRWSFANSMVKTPGLNIPGADGSVYPDEQGNGTLAYAARRSSVASNPGMLTPDGYFAIQTNGTNGTNGNNGLNHYELPSNPSSRRGSYFSFDFSTIAPARRTSIHPGAARTAPSLVTVPE